MKVLLQARHIELSDALRDYCERHLVAHIRRFYDNPAAKLVIQLADASGPKGGIDQEARLTLFMPGAPVFHVVQRTDDAFKSLDQARDRLIRRMKQEIQKWRSPSGHGPLENPIGRTAAASERQRTTREDDPEASAARVKVAEPWPHV